MMVRFNVNSKYQFYLFITIDFFIVSFENVVSHQERVAIVSFPAHIGRDSTVAFSLTLIDVYS